MSETVLLVGKEKRDEWDRVIGREILAEIKGCVVSPAGDQVVRGDSFEHGDITTYQVLAPAGTHLKDGDLVQIRGEVYKVDPIYSFDYSVGRRPVLRSHKPKVIFTVSRGEVSDGLA